MAEWMGKPDLREEDIRKSNPSLAKHFPMLVRYFVEAQSLRVTIVLSPEKAEKFKEAVRKTYSGLGPTTIHLAAEQAIDDWIESHS